MRGEERLISVIQTLNEGVVGAWNTYVLQKAARHLHHNLGFNAGLLADLTHIAFNDPSDHLRGLARDALIYGKGETA
jgi:hypothetical protein